MRGNVHTDDSEPSSNATLEMLWGRGGQHCTTCSLSNFWKILSENEMHQYHVYRIQVLLSSDYAPSIAFAQRCPEKLATDPLYPVCMNPTNGATFTRERTFSTHNPTFEQ
ncbi:hypothetical protein NPIL_452861 [Nephila pilipes]|uniref:Uncharacterized protein n=1 Tax=Nephila pilipes TaxID=299642 RepID=A0A8X6JW61_NEPPI|nr:hypothetical protein NPIL_433611 [Nephila pilipes]GFS40254.1 hypothetical protein NPIL_343441 [Nephila pilipes]GFS90712.1 hypothetical protein NPIL_167271 [Nephila pilipes]GFS92036.1 hypothetical protein NPIL_452861 [Nephila pilipes]